MTAAPASLHVETPTLADVKSTYPPTPVTARSQHSATSSHSDLRAPLMSEPPLPTKSAAKHTPPLEVDTSAHPQPPSSPAMPQEDAGHAAVDQGRYEEGQHSGLAPRISLPGIVCAPPDILPPSPPLTVADAREDHAPVPESSSLHSLQVPVAGTSSAAPPMREEDITSWRASMDGDAEKRAELEAEKDENDDEVDEIHGEYDPYDLGYSPESPVGPSHARAPATPTGAVSLQQTLDHPLANPPTPPLWELIPPPQSTPGTAHGGPRPLTTRPLIPHSAYYFGPPPIDSAYGTDPVGHIGVHHPREILRVERDYASGELPQFAATYPLELEGRITPTQFLDTINTINEHLIEAYSLRSSFVDNALAFFTLQLSRLVLRSQYEKEMARLRRAIDELNTKVYNPVGLNILWPRKMAFMFLEIEYY